MKKIVRSTVVTVFLLLTCLTLSAQAKLTIVNNSMRLMTVKVMKGYSSPAELYESVTVNAYDRVTVYFSNSGTFFTKTKAVLNGKDPVYRKGESFQVTSNSTGYSVMTLTFTIVESTIPQATGGKTISKSEFDQN